MTNAITTPIPRVFRRDRIAFWPTASWLAFIALVCLLLATDRPSLPAFMLALVGLPCLGIASLILVARAFFFRRWRNLLSHLFAPVLATSLLLLIGNRTIDLDVAYFLLVKYPHEMALRLLPREESRYHTWNWGIDAPLGEPGVIYDLVYDASGNVLRGQKEKKGRQIYIRPMGDHFYFVAESEDHTNVCPRLRYSGTPLRWLGLGSADVNTAVRRACEAANDAFHD